ncbi:hypothetical protein [Pseudacidovorax sp. RU35E]|uniref:hypothetical protein n=1 Tax=Pseudacidovorax sp. RU35E TaxID=1907403 RepID=UPI00117B464B|nr:hypothetical protein [Pseudacidovorax sp. RU35E]
MPIERLDWTWAACLSLNELVLRAHHVLTSQCAGQLPCRLNTSANLPQNLAVLRFEEQGLEVRSKALNPLQNTLLLSEGKLGHNTFNYDAQRPHAHARMLLFTSVQHFLRHVLSL